MANRCAKEKSVKAALVSRAPTYPLCDLLDGCHGGHVKMATPALVVDEHAVLHAPLDGLLRGLHHLWKHNPAYQNRASGTLLTKRTPF